MRKRPIVLVLLGLIILSAAALYAIGWHLSQPVPAPVGRPPADLAAEPIAFPSESGSTIRGWLSRGNPQRAAVLLLPGVRSNRLVMVRRAQFLRAAGYSTLLIDFQATGESPGDAITFGWRERFDVLAAVHALRERLPGSPIGIIGTSLGGAATLLATPPLDVRAVVLEAVYPSIDAAIQNRLAIRIGGLGRLLAPLLLFQLSPRLGIDPSRLRPVDHIRQLRSPVLVIGGMEDLHTTEADTRALYDAANQPKELWLIPHVSHVDYFDAVGNAYRDRVLAFFGLNLRLTND